MVKKSEKKPLSDEESLALAQKRAEAKKAAVDDVLNRFGILCLALRQKRVAPGTAQVWFACHGLERWRVAFSLNG